MAELKDLLFAAIEKGEKAEVARLLKEGATRTPRTPKAARL
jgi:hypothetical protein